MIVAAVCFAVFGLVVASMFFRGADPISPARVFTLVWSAAIGLAQLKLSALQGEWSPESWFLLLGGVAAFVLGAGMAFVVNLKTIVPPLRSLKTRVRDEKVDGRKLFRWVVGSAVMYFVSYAVIYAVKGFLPIFVVGTKVSRVDFYVFGFGVLINATAFISYFTLLYCLAVSGETKKKVGLAVTAALALGSYFLLLQRYQIIMAIVIAMVYLYYSRRQIRFRLVAAAAAVTVGFFYWIASLRVSHLVGTYLYSLSKMKMPKDYAMLTEPYMYIVMNLENFARGVERLETHTWGYFSLDFATAITGLKYPLQDYFAIDRTPFLNSGYNTYTTLWWFYTDFGVLGTIMLPLVWGFLTGAIYYRMRRNPTLSSVTQYAVAVFAMVISFFEFPFSHLWFNFNILALFVILRSVTGRGKGVADSSPPGMGDGRLQAT
jgi:oligosaccharide repeat unit polymerase